MATMRKIWPCTTHIEAEGCIVNIREKLSDRNGRAVTSIEILPDDHFCGERIWKTLPRVVNVRVVQLKKVYRSKY